MGGQTTVEQTKLKTKQNQGKRKAASSPGFPNKNGTANVQRQTLRDKTKLVIQGRVLSTPSRARRRIHRSAIDTPTADGGSYYYASAKFGEDRPSREWLLALSTVIYGNQG
jgi:hypothetical protein